MREPTTSGKRCSWQDYVKTYPPALEITQAGWMARPLSKLAFLTEAIRISHGNVPNWNNKKQVHINSVTLIITRRNMTTGFIGTLFITDVTSDRTTITTDRTYY